jgi:hypothetical protein
MAKRRSNRMDPQEDFDRDDLIGSDMEEEPMRGNLDDEMRGIAEEGDDEFEDTEDLEDSDEEV